MKETSTVGRIRELLAENLFIEDAAADSDLIASGQLDSAGFMQVFALLEEDFEISIELADLDREHFRTMLRMADFVDRKRDAPDPAGTD
ncbi:acyl carrier protein [Saccharopolyspora sp. SCSIO 74807]|uniref:acyl carrier protein n=1 Tax=Saccharopolyspora sp. SCSIO 74807 TaxID=3118084 RepID=UPI0030CA773B